MVLTRSAIRVLVGVSFSLILIAGAAGYCGDGQTNFVKNGGFEYELGSGENPDHWNATRVPQMKDFVDLKWDKDFFHSGKRSVSITIGKDHPRTMIHYHWNQAPLKCIPGLTYEISGWIKTQDLKESASILVQCWDRGMKKRLGLVSTEHDYKVLGTSDWTEVKTTIKIPEGTWRVVILAGILGHANPGGKVWFDDISVVHVSDDG
ncbi:MAG: carbohydrate binding domain-containing protein [Candidatus Krumholzibacteriota bacterium]|nr:carbohydrate binding domain-containing protein [Candidatus Krumholzibacteriota bacterium]